MDRRSLLQGLLLSGASTLLHRGPSSVDREVVSGDGRAWGYVGDNGPAHWGELSPDYRVCGWGQQQSPIDLRDPVVAQVSPLALDYRAAPLRLTNTGRTIQVNLEPGSILTLNDRTYTLQQIHFHHPSEHTLEGVAFPMEIHLVHRSEAGDMAVLAVFLQAGAENPALTPIWAAMPTRVRETISPPATLIDAIALLPTDSATFRYFGSLTTPPCSEIVNWIIFQTPMEASSAQINQFAALFANNARPVQSSQRPILLGR